MESVSARRMTVNQAIEDRGSRIEDRGSRIEDRGSRIEDRGSRIKTLTRSSILDPRSYILDPRSSIFPSLSLLLRVEPFAQAVADEIERHHREHHRQAGKDEQVRRDAKKTARVVKHHAPTRRGRRHPQTQEA